VKFERIAEQDGGDWIIESVCDSNLQVVIVPALIRELTAFATTWAAGMETEANDLRRRLAEAESDRDKWKKYYGEHLRQQMLNLANGVQANA